MLRSKLNSAVISGKIDFLQYQKIWSKVANDDELLADVVKTGNDDLLEILEKD